MEDFERAYELPNPPFLFVNNDLTRLFEGKKYPILTDKRGHASYVVQHFTKLREKPCIEQMRLMCPALKLQSTGDVGRVLFRFRFHIEKTEHKRQGVASKLIADEEVHIARKWRADEIQALVVSEGFRAWTRRRFEYTLTHADLLRLRAECARRKFVSEAEAQTIDSVHAFPAKFWEHMSSQDNVSVTLYKKVS